MNEESGRTPRRKRRIGGLSMVAAGLLPLVLGIVGAVGYLERGFVVGRDGERFNTTLGLITYAALILCGLTLVGYGSWYLGRGAPDAKSNGQP